MPQPKWAVLQAMNFIVMGVFVSSVTFAVVNYRQSLNQPMISGTNPLTNVSFPLLLIWGCCLAYFFGFFGISFLDMNELSKSSNFDTEKYLLNTQQLNVDSDDLKKPNSKKSNVQFSNVVQTKHIPRHDTAICAEINKPKVSAPIVSDADTLIVKSDANKAESNSDDINFTVLSDDEILNHLKVGTLKDYQLEKKVGDYERAVHIRRLLYEFLLERKIDQIPYTNYDYGKVFGANCEIVVGYVPIPVGIVGPLILNGEPTYIPMATTEGCLVASTNRGCKAISSSGGCQSVLLKDGITRAPCLRMPSALRAAALKAWLLQPDNYSLIENAFNSTTSYGRLESIDATIAGRNVYLRFCCMAGDAMGMNMVSKGCLKAIELLEIEFPDLELIAISGNMCTDKKPSAINWILGRGKSIVCEAVIPEKIVKNVLKTTVDSMVETNKQKNHIGSAMAGSIGGFNAHAANIVTAVFLATGQDPAQNVESSNCITIFEKADDGKSLYVSVTMPSIEVGTVGGGTHLPAQAACLDICNVRGASKGPNSMPGDNARKLAQIVGAAVLAGELSLIAALAANHLVRSHMQHNRKPSEPAPTQRDHQDSLIRKNSSTPDLSSV